MKRVTLPSTDLEVSRLSFGTASLHHLPSSSQRQLLLASVAEHGITHFDTSPYYGFGLAELEIGRFLKSHNNSLTIATKVGLYPPGQRSSLASIWSRKAIGRLVPSFSRPVVDWSIAQASKSLDRSLRQLRRDYVDILFLHEPKPGLLDVDEFMEWLVRQREKGKLRYWGLAGPADLYEDWIREGHELAHILQARDHTASNDHPILNAGRCFQLTYGYLAAAHGMNERLQVGHVLRAALKRNSSGSVLVATRRIAHIAELVLAAETL